MELALIFTEQNNHDFINYLAYANILNNYKYKDIQMIKIDHHKGYFACKGYTLDCHICCNYHFDTFLHFHT